MDNSVVSPLVRTFATARLPGWFNPTRPRMTSQETNGVWVPIFSEIFSTSSLMARIELARSGVRTATSGVETIRAARNVFKNDCIRSDTRNSFLSGSVARARRTGIKWKENVRG